MAQEKIHALQPSTYKTSKSWCGVWRPVFVANDLDKVTCGRCRRILAQRKVSQTGKTSVE